MDLMYLLNAIYFKGIWTNEFDPKNTSPKPFTLEDGSRVDMDMMHQTAKFKYTEDANLQVVQLPYGNEAFSMLVLSERGQKLERGGECSQRRWVLECTAIESRSSRSGLVVAQVQDRV